MRATVRPIRVLLIDPVYGRHTPFWSAPLALGYIAATLDAHFGKNCRIELVRDRDGILSHLRSERYDAIASTNYVWNTRLSNKFLEIARELQPGAVTIQGGPHFQNDEPDIAAEYLRAHSSIDYYVHGEGETTMVELLEKLFGGSGLSEAEPGVSFLRDGEYLDGGRRERRRDLDTIPSPHLGGWLDPFIGNGYAPVIETNRGCPFSCTYCNWGSATVSKVNRFSLDRVMEELDYIARRVRDNDNLTVADANFGILKRDLEIAEKIESLWQSQGYPAHIQLWYTKNSSRRTIEIGEILGKKVRFLLAIQSLNEEVLANIKRDNIKLKTYEELTVYARERSLLTASDVIIGLPGEDLPSVKNNMETLHSRGVEKVDVFSLMLIPGTELYSRETRRRFGMRTMHRLAQGCIIDVEGDVISETEELVVENDTMSFEDFLMLNKYSALSVFWHHSGMGDALSNYARHRGIVESTMFFEFLEYRENSPETVKGLRYLDTLLRNELHPEAEGVHQAAVGQRVDELRTTRASYGFIHEVIRQGLVPAMIDDMIGGLVRIMERRADTGIPAPDPREVENLRTFTKAYEATLDTNAESTISVDYDFLAWMEQSFNADMANVRVEEPMRLHLSRARGRLPNAKLESVNASTCTQPQFTEWLYFIRNTRDYVDVTNAENEAAA
jgi:radical SAM superfamily enzyme YgiQ (UPF0313 family)